MLRLSLLSCALLLALPPLANAESPMPDPVPPAVVGRPFEQAPPARPASQKPPKAKPVKPKKAAATQEAPTKPRAAKAAVDDRADPRMRTDDVGKGTHLSRKPLGPGAYFADRHRTAVRRYYAAHPASGTAANWKIGEPVPRGASVAPVPQGLLASLPRLPPGHSYLQLGGEVVLVASGSKMVVDGISRKPR